MGSKNKVYALPEIVREVGRAFFFICRSSRAALFISIFPVTGFLIASAAAYTELFVQMGALLLRKNFG